MFGRLFLLVGIACNLGCNAKLTVPSEALISCATTTDCPGDLVCNEVLRRCVDPDQLDLQAPTLLVSEVVPALGTRGTPFTVTFTVSEPLLDLPEVQVDLGNQQAPLVLSDADGESYSFIFTPDMSTPEGFLPVFVTARDTSGNISRGLGAGAIRVDATAPGIVSVQSPLYRSDNALDTPTAAKDGTLITLGLSTDEALAFDPIVRAQCIGEELVFVPEDPGAGVFSFIMSAVFTSASAVQDGACPIVADLTDLAGNVENDVPLGIDLLVDRSQPVPLTLAQLDALVHLRIPHGALRTGGEPGQYLASAILDADTDPEGTLVPIDAVAESGAGAEQTPIVRIELSSDAANTNRLGVLFLDENGEFRTTRLGRTDDPELWISRVDRAGNPSVPQRIPRGVWTTSFNDKIGGAAFPNPQGYDAHTRLEMLNGLGFPLGQAAGIGALDGVIAETDGAGEWRDHDSVALPRPSRPIPWAVDTARSAALFFDRAGRTLEKVGPAVHSRIPTDPEGDGNPAARRDPLLSYDPVRRRTAMFGGIAEFGVECDAGSGNGTTCSNVWEWDGKSWEEIETSAGPSTFIDGDAVFDGERLVVFVGGALWGWDGSDWTLLCGGGHPTCTGPSSRTDFALTYDGARNRVVLFGGAVSVATDCLGSDNECRDTWEWNATLGQWLEQSSATMPPARRNAAMAWDPRDGRAVLFGGNSEECGGGSLSTCKKLWFWDGTDWSSKQLARYRGGRTTVDNATVHRMFFDPVARRITMARTFNFTLLFWELRGGSWVEATPDQAGGIGPARWVPPLFDANIGRLVGTDNTPEVQLGKAGSWETCSSFVCDPSQPWEYASSGFDPQTRTGIQFGGIDFGEDPSMDVYQWDGTDWSSIVTSGAPARAYVAATYFPPSQGYLFFGGSTSFEGAATNEMWLLQGTNWSSLNPAPGPDGNPSPRAAARLHYDPAKQLAYLVGGGGSDLFDDPELPVWVWDGSQWDELPAVLPVETEFGYAAVFDPRAGSLMVFTSNRRVWQMRDDAIVDVTPSEISLGLAPFPSIGNSGDTDPGGRVMLYDDELDESVMVAESLLDDAGWAWRGNTSERPAHRVTLGLLQANLPSANSATYSNATVRVWSAGGGTEATRDELQLRVFEGSASPTLSTSFSGGSLDRLIGRWPNGRWLLIVHSTSPSASGTLNEWCVTLSPSATQFCNSDNFVIGDSTGGSAVSVIDLSDEQLAQLSGVDLSVDLTHDQVDDLLIELVAQPALGGAASGAELMAWNSGQWQSLGSNTEATTPVPSPTSNPHPWEIAWESADASEIHRLLVDDEMHIAVAPRGYNGMRESSVAVDYLETTLSYTLP